jgi:DNA-binding PadR family transcriptional regulator
MSTTAAFGPGDWLSRLINDLSCGNVSTMSGRRSAGAKGWGGPPWAFGPWAGGWPGAGSSRGDWWTGGGRPRAGRGDVRSAILSLLTEGPRHGYQIIQDIAERSGGAWRASPGSVYPALAALQDEGLVDDEKIEGRRVYALTQAGREHVAQRRDELSAVFAAYAPPDDDGRSEDYGRLMLSVGAAAVEVVRTGTPEQVAQASRLLAQVRSDLYGVLTDSGQVPEDQDGSL